MIRMEIALILILAFVAGVFFLGEAETDRVT